MMHDVHPHGPAILWDNCLECEERGKDPHRCLTQLDGSTFKRAWERAWRLQMKGLPDGQHAELLVLRALIGVQLNIERLTGDRYGTIRGLCEPPLGDSTNWLWSTERRTGPRFTVEIETANSWFVSGSLSSGLAALLRKLADDLELRGVDDQRTLLDGNGNTVGVSRYAD